MADEDKDVQVFLNGSTTPLASGPAAAGLQIPALGFTVKASNTEAATAYFKFQYASEPATDDDKI